MFAAAHPTSVCEPRCAVLARVALEIARRLNPKDELKLGKFSGCMACAAQPVKFVLRHKSRRIYRFAGPTSFANP